MFLFRSIRNIHTLVYIYISTHEVYECVSECMCVRVLDYYTCIHSHTLSLSRATWNRVDDLVMFISP